MVDSVQIWPPGFRMTDALGNVLSGAQVRFFDAGTTTPKEMFSDKGLSVSLGTIIYTRSDGAPVASEGSNTTVTVYTDTDDYKVDVLDADDVTVFPAKDNVRGALGTSTFLTAASVSTFSLPVLARSTNLTLDGTHKGKLIDCNPSGSFTLTLTAAATLGDGWLVYIMNSAAAGQVIVSASEAVSFAGSTFTSYALEPGELMAIDCNGVAFKVFLHAPPRMPARGPGVLTISSRVATAPVSPTPGARYIATAIFTTGAITTAVGDIIEANGVSFNKYTPVSDCGWIAWVQDEDRYYSYQNAAWVLALDPAASDTVAGLIEIADQSEIEAATDVLRAVTPGRMKYHPGVVKFWANFNGSGTPASIASYNLSSITDNGAGDWTLNFLVAFSSTAYCPVSMPADSGGNSALIFQNTRATGSLRITCGDETVTGGGDPASVCVAIFGDQ